MKPIKMLSSLEGSRRTQFCALEYRDQEQFGPSSPDRVIIVLSKSETGHVSVLVHPDWRTLVSPRHQQYIGALLADFGQRIKTDPEKLLEQTSALSVGPLVTHASGNSLKSYPPLEKICGGFVDA